nr:ATP-binding protein [Bacteroides congonensis]
MFLGKHASKPYNKNIADIFFKAGFIEAWGRGISKIMKGFADAGMELPTFEFSMGGLWVVMKRKVFGEVTPQVSVPVSVPVTAPVIMEILNSKEYVNSFIYLFSEKQECSSREIMEAWGLLSLRYVRLNYITPLLKAGILRLKYPDNPNHPQQRYLLNEIK